MKQLIKNTENRDGIVRKAIRKKKGRLIIRNLVYDIN